MKKPSHRYVRQIIHFTGLCLTLAFSTIVWAGRPVYDAQYGGIYQFPLPDGSSVAFTRDAHGQHAAGQPAMTLDYDSYGRRARKTMADSQTIMSTTVMRYCRSV